MTDTEQKVLHPAKFSDAILERLDMLVPDGLYLDPFAGTGRVHELERAGRRTVGIEIEPEWAACNPRTYCGDSLYLDTIFDPETFDGIITSPCYGNRFADHHNAKDSSKRRSYTHDLRTMTKDENRKLHKHNAGTLHFGREYQIFHESAYVQWTHVLKPGGMVYLNVSDFIRAGKRVPAVAWHAGTLRKIGFEILGREKILTPRMRHGENHAARVDHEWILIGRME